MEQAINEAIRKSTADNLTAAVGFIGDALTELEADGNCVDFAVDLWKIQQSLVRFKARFEFRYRLGIWSALQNCSKLT